MTYVFGHMERWPMSEIRSNTTHGIVDNEVFRRDDSKVSAKFHGQDLTRERR